MLGTMSRDEMSASAVAAVVVTGILEQNLVCVLHLRENHVLALWAAHWVPVQLGEHISHLQTRSRRWLAFINPRDADAGSRQRYT